MREGNTLGFIATVDVVVIPRAIQGHAFLARDNWRVGGGALKRRLPGLSEAGLGLMFYFSGVNNPNMENKVCKRKYVL